MVSAAVSVELRIHEVRGARVMLSTDLAALYGVTPKALSHAVKRNTERFPADLMFQLTADEYRILKSQSGLQDGEACGGSARKTIGFR